MKTNEAPEKLYVNIYDHLTQKGYYAFTNKITEDDIEYVHKDDFIEKAVEWLDNNLWNYYDTGNIGDFETLRFEHFTQMIEDFRKYMKGVKH